MKGGMTIPILTMAHMFACQPSYSPAQLYQNFEVK